MAEELEIAQEEQRVLRKNLKKKLFFSFWFNSFSLLLLP